MYEVLAPRDEADIKDLVAAAIGNETPIEIRGGGTRCGLGRPIEAAIAVSMAGLSGVRLYEPAELVMTVSAGTSLAIVRDLLTQNGQELAFEPMSHAGLYGRSREAETVGGLMAVNASGSRRIKVGAARDHLLGFRAVNGRSEVFKSGGRVMKNVTGYDMSKLMAGAFGTLGIMTELTFKVLPKPDCEKTVVAIGLRDATAVRQMTRVTGLSLEVSSLGHLPKAIGLPEALHGAGLDGHPITLFRVEGPETSVDTRCEALRTELRDVATGLETIDPLGSRALWTHLRDVGPLAAADTSLWRISTAPANGADLVSALRARDLPIGGYYFDWAGGLIWLALEHEDETHAAVIRAETLRLGGHATLVRGSEPLRRSVAIFQPQGPALSELSARVRRSFDPALILNRGRLREDL